MTAIEELIKYTEELKSTYDFSFDKFFDKAHELLKKEQQDKVEFAKMHVTEALKQASEKAQLSDDSNCYGEAGYCSMTHPCKFTILNAYPLDQIK